MSVHNLAGQQLGQYELRQVLGKGGMGAVYLAYQASLKREVAVKVLPPLLAAEPGYAERFNREALVAASLEHPNIVSIYDYGTQDDISYVVMQLLTGGSLGTWIETCALSSNAFIPLSETASLLGQLAEALDYAHSRGVLHRDIKPSNIMFDSLHRPYLVDFGLAKLLGSTTKLTASNTPMGTPAFMPPEQWTSQDLTPAADQYALAVTAYQMVTGRLPFTSDTPYGLMHQHLNVMPEAPQVYRSDVPAALAAVFWRALAKDPADRYESVSQFAQAFTNAVESVGESDTPVLTAAFSQPVKPTASKAQPPAPTRSPARTAPAAPTRTRRSPWGCLVLLAGLIGAVGVALVMMQSNAAGEHALPTRAVLPSLTPITSIIANSAPTQNPTETATSERLMIVARRATARAATALAPAASPSSTATPLPTRTPAWTPTRVPTRTPIPTATMSAWEYFQLAQQYAEGGDYENAIAAYSIALTLDPYFAEAYLARGWLYVSPFGSFDQAIVDFTNAVDLLPDNADAYYARGYTYTILGSYEQAVIDYNAALYYAPDNAEYYFQRGEAHFYTENYAQAISDYSSTLSLDGEYLNAYIQRARASAAVGDYNQAVADFSSALDRDSGNIDLYIGRGDSYAALGDGWSAVNDFTTATQLNYDLDYAFLRLGDLYYDLGMGAESLAHYRRYTELVGDAAEAYVWERIFELETSVEAFELAQEQTA